MGSICFLRIIHVSYLLTGTFPLEFAINLIKAKIFSRDWIGDRQTACEL